MKGFPTTSVIIRCYLEILLCVVLVILLGKVGLQRQKLQTIAICRCTYSMNSIHKKDRRTHGLYFYNIRKRKKKSRSLSISICIKGVGDYIIGQNEYIILGAIIKLV